MGSLRVVAVVVIANNSSKLPLTTPKPCCQARLNFPESWVPEFLLAAAMDW